MVITKMNMLDFPISLLQCPNCKANKLVNENDASLICESCKMNFPLNHGRPILLNPKNELFKFEDYIHAKLPTFDNGKSLGRFFPTSSVNLSAKRVINRLSEILSRISSARVLVVGGGRQRHWLDNLLRNAVGIQILYSDIDIHADVDLFCDGHDLPFVDNTFDAIITTAVLEHLLYPERVVSEIHRVLKINGKLYSELPFMQQVHEGAYDFTRYTHSGHRRLLNGFEEIESGMVAGPGTVMVWTIENFVLAFFSNQFIRKAAKATIRLLFFWLRYFDYMLEKKAAAMDGASCTYFLGSKIEGKISDSKIIEAYNGGKHLKHT